MTGSLGVPDTGPCPCGTGRRYADCCGPLHAQQAQAQTAEELMRSRYSAYARGDSDHVFRTWHPRTRPGDVSTHDDLRWEGLEVLDTHAGGPTDDEGTVEFRATYRVGTQRAVLHERSTFTRRGGRWVYLDGAEVTPG